MNTLAVTSTGTFWTGDEFDHWRREYEKRRSSLQQCGTRWAHENIQSVGRKEEGRFKLMLHRISNELVTEARENGCPVIAFEDLTDIRERTGASWGHKWVFDRLYEYVEYKAEDTVLWSSRLTLKTPVGVARTVASRTPTTARTNRSSA